MIKRPRPSAVVVAILFALAASCSLAVKRAAPPPGPAWLPVGQLVAPVGIQVELPGLRPQVLALSPDGASSSLRGRRTRSSSSTRRPGSSQRVPLPAGRRTRAKPETTSDNILKPDDKGQVSYHRPGLLSRRPAPLPQQRQRQHQGLRRPARRDDRRAVLDPPAPASAPPPRGGDPSGIAVSPDGARLYVALNLSNRLGEFDASSGQLLRLFDVGVAPYDVVLVGEKAYVSNWGGRRPQAGRRRPAPPGQGTPVKVDPATRSSPTRARSR